MKVADLLRNQMINKNKSRYSGHVRTNLIRMSDAGSCSKKIYYKVIGEEAAEFTDHNLMIFEYGHEMHDILQKNLETYGEQGSESLKQDGKFDITYHPGPLFHSPEQTLCLVTPKFRTIYGHCDMLMGTDTVLEFKTSSAKSFKFIKDKLGASESHKLQASLYCVAANRDKYKIIYFSRTDDETWFHEYDGEVIEADVKRELDRFDSIYDAAINVTPPSVNYSPRSFPCSWKGGACNYFRSCYGEK